MLCYLFMFLLLLCLKWTKQIRIEKKYLFTSNFKKISKGEKTEKTKQQRLKETDHILEIKSNKGSLEIE